MTLASIPLMDRTGRRTLHLYGLGGMFIFSIFITISFLIKASSIFHLECLFETDHTFERSNPYQLNVQNMISILRNLKLTDDLIVQML